MLKDADFKPVYASGRNEPSDFFIEGLSNSFSFDLGLGYFRSTGFKVLAVGFARFLINGGTMRFIINDSLEIKDKNAILTGQNEESDREYEKALLADFESLAKTLTKRDKHFFNCLSWLIASDRLQIIAVKPKKNKVGIVHHKFGVFTDTDHNKAVFNGSINFSQYALQYNIETLWTEYSWMAEGMSKARIDEMVQLFEETWNGISSVVRVIPIEEIKVAIHNHFPKKNLKELVEEECQLADEVIREYKLRGSDPSKIEAVLKSLTEKYKTHKVIDPVILQSHDEQALNKWRHQDEAVNKFLESERGVLNMATGTGKTKTALRICAELIDKGSIDSIIIACDGTDLLFQWYGQLLSLVAQKDLSWSILRQYGDHRESERYRNNPSKKILLTSRLQLPLGMIELNSEKGQKTLLIHDEVHKLGSMGNRTKLEGLSDNIRYRLGLSATPEREYDVNGTEFVTKHIGPIIFEFGLDKAIERGILAPFNYFPVVYNLTSKDKSRISQVYKRRATSIKMGNPISDEEFWTALSMVYKTSEGKIPLFRQFISSNLHLLEKSIIFVETREYGEEILDIVHQFKTDFHSYYGGDDSEILSRFSGGLIDCLLTCHRLSEGIDIPSLNTVILVSSSRAKLETIQRIGRCLRLDPNNPNKVANVVDFVRESTEEIGNNPHADEERRQFLTDLSSIKPKVIL